MRGVFIESWDDDGNVEACLPDGTMFHTTAEHVLIEAGSYCHNGMGGMNLIGLQEDIEVGEHFQLFGENELDVMPACDMTDALREALVDKLLEVVATRRGEALEAMGDIYAD